MQWDHTTNAGFSAAPKEKLYVKQDESADRPTVEAQMADPDSLYHEIQKLINIRQAHSALQSRGEIEFVYAEENNILWRICAVMTRRRSWSSSIRRTERSASTETMR